VFQRAGVTPTLSGAAVSLPILPNLRIGDYRAYEVLG
jgi:hypothetical protein